MLNIEPPLEPPERDDQERINRLYDVRERVWEAEDEIEED